MVTAELSSVKAEWDGDGVKFRLCLGCSAMSHSATAHDCDGPGLQWAVHSPRGQGGDSLAESNGCPESVEGRWPEYRFESIDEVGAIGE